MKILQKALAATLAVTLAVAPVSIATVQETQAAAASSIKVLFGKKATVEVGETFKLVLKVSPSSAGVTYKSSNKKIVSVSKKGIIKGIKPGKATITIKAKEGSKKATSKVTVKPKQVTSVKAASGTENGTALVSWKAQKNVKGYKIYASQKKKSGYKLVATVKGAKKTNATVTGLGGGTYYFKVKAYSGKLASEYSKAVSVKLWSLVWSDEFNGTSLDMNNWTYEVGNGIDGWGNQELEIYTEGKNLKFENGNLVIIPRIEYNKATGKYANATSTRIISRGKKQFKYGKIEIRAKASKGKGTWSAGWMLGTNGQTWPANGEIDIFESMNGFVPQTIHCPYFNNQASAKGGNKNFDSGLTQAQCAEAYHTYGIIWDDEKIQFTVDGVVKSTYAPGMYNTNIMPLSETWNCFKYPFYFILNCAIGGNAAGEVSKDGWTLVGENGDVQTYEDYCYIDYVRVYQ